MATNAKMPEAYNELFPELDSPLDKTDPEFTEYFNNFAFGEVVGLSKLEPKLRLMTQLAALIGCQGQAEFRFMLGAALGQGVTPVEAKEVVYQTVPYVGIGKALEFLTITNEVLTERGVKLPLEGQSTTTPENRFEKGEKVQKDIFGAANIDGMRENFPEDLKHICDLLSDNCFGDNYTRTGLDVATRELITFSCLIAQGGCDSQAKSHAVGNLNVGNTREQLIDVTTQLLPFIGYPRTLNGIAAINAATQK